MNKKKMMDINIGETFKMLKTKMKIKNKDLQEADQNSSDEATNPNEPAFQAAESSLSLREQAMSNLLNFKKYLEQNPANPSQEYEVVYQSISHAFSDLTNQISTLQNEKEKANAEYEKYTEQLGEKIMLKSNFERQITDLTAEKRKERNFLDEQVRVNNKIVLEKERTSKNKEQIRILSEKIEQLKNKITEEKQRLEQEIEKTQKLTSDNERIKLKFQDKQNVIDSKMKKGDNEIKVLMTQAKKAESVQIEQMNVEKKPQVPVNKENTTFMIDDNVKVSNEEIHTLKYMVSEIQKENKSLSIELESKKMDVDCLMQENLGLKQIIREMTKE